jgi:hypothetical protein
MTRTLGMLGLALAMSVAGRASAEPVQTVVVWADDGGGEGVALFDGTMDSQELAGTIDFGTDTFQVDGTVDASGAVEGTVSTGTGSPVLTFETTAVGTEVAGEFTVTSSEGGIWVTETPEPPHVG